MSDVQYTPAQQEAIDVGRRHLDACVVAGPGSGKTTVLVEYFRGLVAAGVDPLRILAITFTEKAAGNMRSRLASAFRDNREIRAKLERAWVSTVHGFCARLLHENAVFAGIDPEFVVADERDSWRMQRESISEALSGLLAEQPAAMRALIRGLSSYEFEESVLAAYDAMRGAGLRIDDLAKFPPPPGGSVPEIAATLSALRGEATFGWNPSQREQFAVAVEGAERIVSASGPLRALQAVAAYSCNLNKCKRSNRAFDLLKQMRDQIEAARYSLITEHFSAERETLFEILRRFDRLYRERKRVAGALDFSDLEEFAVRLLESHSQTRERVRAQFDQILMDEFQDTNGQQARLMQLVRAPNNFYAVGDINQSIFGFRHAEPDGFELYRDEVDASRGRLVELTDNFRSRQAILSAVETICHGAKGIRQRPLVAGKKFDRARDLSVEVLSAPDLTIEAKSVARRIVELAAEGFAFREFAVLVRNTEVIAEFTEAFDAAGIPYVVNRGKGFYATREVNDLTHLLRVIANPRDEISLATVLRSPLVGVSDEALLALRTISDNLGGGLMRLGSDDLIVDLSPEDSRKLTMFRDRLRSWRTRREYVTFDRLLLEALDHSSYRPDTRGWANVEKFLAQARDAARRKSLDQFVDELDLLRASDPREPDAPVDEVANAVKVMTVHSSKGLEFPVVIVAALHKGVESSPPVVAFSRTYGLGARWRNPAAREDKDDLYQHAIREEWKRREQEESDRLLYVAMTRAEQHLVLSFSALRQWSKTVAERLNLTLEAARDEVVGRTAPDGKAWNLRVQVVTEPPELVRAVVATAGSARAEVQVLDPPAITGQQDTNATVTALARFANCPREYFLGSYLGYEGRQRKLREADDENLPANELGTQVHALLANTVVPDPDSDALRLVETFRQSPLGRRAAKASRVEREFDFLMSIEDLVIRGQVDLWFEENGELNIVDYKTDDIPASQVQRRAQDYALQLRLYAIAVEKVAGRPVDRAWLHFLRPNVAVEIDLKPSLLDSPEDTAREFQKAQSNLDFPLNEGERCQRCPFFKDLCPANPEGTTS